MKSIILILLFFTFLQALIVEPESAMMQTFKCQSITQKSILMTQAQHQKIQKIAASPLESKLFRLYIAKELEQTIGFGVLLTQKVRSKNTAVLYMLSLDGEIRAIEILAFNEPREYLPNRRYLGQYLGKQTQRFVHSKNIDSISGATLSANAIIKSANIAKAIWKEILKQ